MIRDVAEAVPVGVAVQDGNFEDRHPETGQRVTLGDMVEFATGYLNADYTFWGTQEPYYSRAVVPYLRGEGAP